MTRKKVPQSARLSAGGGDLGQNIVQCGLLKVSKKSAKESAFAYKSAPKSTLKRSFGSSGHICTVMVVT